MIIKAISYRLQVCNSRSDYDNPEMRKAGHPIEWYIENAKPKIQASILDSFEQPICFMCMEKDIESCHRKVILKALHEQGLRGRDLYPVSS